MGKDKPPKPGTHSSHLPPRRHLNKGVNPVDPRTGKTASRKSVEAMARGQGRGTKDDAKAARDER